MKVVPGINTIINLIVKIMLFVTYCSDNDTTSCRQNAWLGAGSKKVFIKKSHKEKLL